MTIAMTLRILTICTGNVCRSPLAAQLLAARLDNARFEIHSAGVAALVGDPMPEVARHIATRLGSTTAHDHEGASVTRQDVAAADLVLGLTLEHRRRVVELNPTALRSSFTLIEFAHIGSAIDDDQLAQVVRGRPDTEQAVLDLLSMMRGVVPPLASTTQYDVIDPYQQNVAMYERSAAQIDTAVNRIVELFLRARQLSGAEPESRR